MANLYDKASLVLPTSPAYKDGAIQAYKPLTSQGTFDFSRGSNLAATRVNADGLIEKGRENLLLQSNQFDTSWIPSRITITANQLGYDGSNDAWLIESTATAQSSRIHQAYTSTGVYNRSVYAKKGTADYLAIYTTGDAKVYFNLSTGTIDTESQNVSASMISVGNGWYRCDATFSSGYDGHYIFIAATNNSTSTNSGDNIYIQDAQLEKGLVATDYIETGTSAAQSGILEDMPRLDYSGGDCPSLLLEPQRANIIDQSEYFGAWTFSSAITLTHNYATSPEGLQNATLLARTTSGNVQQSKNVTSGQTYVISVFAKAGTSSIVNVIATGLLNASVTQFDLSDQSITTTTGSVVNADIEDYGNGWYRCWVIQTASSTGLGQVRINTGDNVNILLYGAQLEQGSYPTSYIPTYGTSTTRGRDDASMTNVSDLIGQTEGTIFFEGSSPSVSSNLINFNHATNSVVIKRQADSSVRGVVSISGPDITFTSSAISGEFKAAIAYKDGDSAFYVNGVQVGTSSTSFSFGAALSEIYLGAGINYHALTNKSECKQALVFKTRLSNAELEALTTL